MVNYLIRGPNFPQFLFCQFFVLKIGGGFTQKRHLRIRHPAIGANPDEPVWHGDLVQVAFLPVHDERVRHPDLGHKSPVERQFSHSQEKTIYWHLAHLELLWTKLGVIINNFLPSLLIKANIYKHKHILEPKSPVFQ